MPAHFSLIAGYPSLLERMTGAGTQEGFPAPEAVYSRHFPPIQMAEEDEVVSVRAVIPGAALADVRLTFVSGKLIIHGVLPVPSGTSVRRERPTGPFRRDVEMPCPIVAEAVTAKMRNGVLTVTLPKERRKAKRSIPVLCIQREQA